MDCLEVRAVAALYVYEDLSVAEMDAVRAHLDRCTDCASEVERCERARGALGAFAPIEAPADVSAIATWAMTARARPVSRVRSVLVGAAAGIVAFVVLSALGVRVEFGGGEPVAPPESIEARICRAVDARLDEALGRFDELAFGWQAAQEERFGDVLDVLRIESERQRVRESLRAREMVDGVLHAVAFPIQPPHRP